MARAPSLQEIELVPEADRFEDFPHPRETSTLCGHADAERSLLQALAAERLHHAWLLAGREGVGKATLAYRFARYLLSPPEQRDRSGVRLGSNDAGGPSRQVRALSHPGLLVIRRPWDFRHRRFAASIPIDEVRRLRAFLGHTVDRGGWRVVIVDTADELNQNAASALLKSLEEPPHRTIFLLLAAEPGRLLPTIRSRCRVLRLSALAAEDLRRAAAAACAAAGRPPPVFDARLEHLAQGSVRRLLQLAVGDGQQLYEHVEAIFTALPRIDWGAAHALADDLASPGSQQRFEAFYGLLLGFLARIIRVRSTRAGVEGTGAAVAARLMPENRLAAWADVWGSISSEKAEVVSLNLDRKAFVLATLSRLEVAARA